jgi:D-3-phosphoglycerate dehydrogenase / 2-oxoglutarate reductase
VKRTKVAVIDNSVTSGAVREYLETHFEVIYVTRQIFLNDRAQILKCNRIIWIHVETLIYARDLESMNSDTILVSTTTGFTHIAKEVISFLGSRFISLKLESDFLKSITSTAELALTFVLMGLTGVQTARADVLKGNWNRLGNVRAKQVSSATAGIIGYGRLGRILASYLRPIVSKVVIWDIDSRACSQAQIDGFEISTNLERF